MPPPAPNAARWRQNCQRCGSLACKRQKLKAGSFCLVRLACRMRSVRRLNSAVNAILAAGPTIERLMAMGAEPLAGTPQDVVTLVAGDREPWGRVIREGGIKVE